MGPLLYQVRASVLLDTIARATDVAVEGVTLYHVPDSYLIDLARCGFDMIYLLGVWQTGKAGVEVSRALLAGEEAAWAVSSPFAIADFHVHSQYGGDDALRDFRRRARRAGLTVLIDFVPNHVARDHRWLDDAPWLLMQGTPADAAAQPRQYFTHACPDGRKLVFAHGRDPNYGPGWADTAQLNYYHPELRRNITAVLRWIAGTGLADGVRCDMAMLVLSDVFATTWRPPPPDTPLPGAWPLPTMSDAHHAAWCGHGRHGVSPSIPPPPTSCDSAATGNPTALAPGTTTMVHPTTTASSATITAVDREAGAGVRGSVIAATAAVTSPSPTTTHATTPSPTDTGSSATSLSTPSPHPPDGKPAALHLGPTSNAASPVPGATSALDIHRGPDRMGPPPVLAGEFWADAIAATRAIAPGFLFLAEVYWDMEYRLMTLGFDYTYDKRLCDRLVHGHPAESIAAHLRASMDFQQRCARFVENHDEERVAAAHVGGAAGAMAAGFVALTVPGLRFVHDGQLAGRTLRHSMHVGPRPREAANLTVQAFYRRLLPIVTEPGFHSGVWHLAAVTPSKDGNGTWRNLLAYWVIPPADMEYVGGDAAGGGGPTTTTGTTAAGTTAAGTTATTTFPTRPSARPPLPPAHPAAASACAGPGAPACGVGAGGTLASSLTSSAGSSSSLGSVTIPEFVGLAVMDKGGEGAGATSGVAAIHPVPAVVPGEPAKEGMPAPMPHLRVRAPAAGTCYLCVVNYSGTAANGHIQFTALDEGGGRGGEGRKWIAGMVAPGTRVVGPLGNDIRMDMDGGDAMTTIASATPHTLCHRLSLVDLCHGGMQEYPRHLLATEGWWMQLAAWECHVYAVTRAVDE